MDGFPLHKFRISFASTRGREGIARRRRTSTDKTAARAFGLALGLAGAIWTFNQPASAARIHVHGAAKLAVQTARSDGDLVVTGALTDDAGEPIAHATLDLSLSLAIEDPSRPAGNFSDAMRMFRPCRGNQARLGAAALAPTPPPPPKTDDAGEFCLRASLAPAKYVVHLGWPGTALMDAAKVDEAVDLERTPLSLRFDPAPRIVHLDETIPLSVVAQIASDMQAPATGLHLVLNDERGQIVAETNTDALGRAHFDVTPTNLAPPGLGSFTVTCRGEECPDGAHESLDVERHATVRLTAHDESLRTKVQVPEEGLHLDVDVKTAIGPVDSGTIEARVGDTVVGAAPVKNGASHLTLTFGAATDGDAAIALRYLPASPWFEPGRGTVAHAAVKSKSGWRDSPFLAIGIVLLAWLIIGRARTGAAKIPPAPPAKAPAPALAELEVVTATEDASRGWTGKLVDAHDGAPLAGAIVAIERGSFEASKQLAFARTNERGEFKLAPIARAPGDAIVASSRLHAELRQVLPPAAASGELVIRLVSRRHALLTRLIAWSRARVRGDARLDPTPAQVRRSANSPDVSRWADAVERAAFGPDEIDAHAEADVDALAPRIARDAADAADPVEPPVDRRRA